MCKLIGFHIVCSISKDIVFYECTIEILTCTVPDINQMNQCELNRITILVLRFVNATSMQKHCRPM